MSARDEKEPFLMNPYVGIINHPPRKKRRTTKRRVVKMAARRKRSSKAHMAYVRSFRKGAKRRAAPARKRRVRRTKARRNPYPLAGAVLANPRRRSRRSVSVARRRHSRRSGYSRNPRIMGIELPPISKVLFAGIGFVAPPMIEGMVSGFVPASIQATTIGKYAVRVGVVAALAYGIRRFIGRDQGNMALIGGGVYIATTAAMEFMPGIFGSHVPTIPAITPPSLSGYVQPNRQLRAYVPANQRINSSLGMPSAARGNVEQSGAMGGTADRFKRF